LLREIRAAIARKGQVAVLSRYATKRDSLDAALAACRRERQRLVSENAGLLLRAVTAEEALVSMKRRTPHALNMNVLQTGSAMVWPARAGSAVLPQNFVPASLESLPQK
jgi:hypothetical protein